MSIIRKTKTVKLILQEFDKINKAISVIDLVEKFSKKMDKTTVYRILDRLEDSGELHSFVDQGGLKRYAKGGVNNKIDSVAYMQVKDLTKSENDQVFIFNGWTFASEPSLTPFDHAIYDLQLLNCNNA